ncbi:MAG TPA: SDR family NAD(P)-dependent oxidoreductase, partial [candidate division Zixibacteria bacterium]|nr:SDR family NAD(P)-dependent oxidoreductase [candidate division Zixibacteria bacterium]
MNGKIRTVSGKAWRIVAGLCLAAGAALGGVVAVNDAVPYPQLVVPEGTAEDPTIFLYDGYHRNFDLVGQGLDIGTYNPYIALHIVNQSVIRSTKIWFLGGDYPNKVGESQDPTDYPGHQAMILDNSDMTTGEFRVGSKNSDNTLTVRNGATMSVGKGLFIDMYDGVGNNAVVVTGVGTGLGKEVATAIFNDGANLVIGARTESQLQAVAEELDPTGERVAYVPTDIADEAACE